jgi:hypothetical protein
LSLTHIFLFMIKTRYWAIRTQSRRYIFYR